MSNVLMSIIYQSTIIYWNFDKKISDSFHQYGLSELQMDYFDIDFCPRNNSLQTIKFCSINILDIGSFSHQQMMVSCDDWT